MDLANHAAAVNSRRGAAFGVAGIARLISGSSAGTSSGSSSSDGFGALGDLLGRQQLLALLPKLYRYQFDPNPRVQVGQLHPLVAWHAYAATSRSITMPGMP